MPTVKIDAIEFSHDKPFWKELVKYHVGYKNFQITIDDTVVYTSTVKKTETHKNTPT